MTANATGTPGAMTEGRLAPDEVRTRTFTRVVRGYRRREVRRLLERAAADLARLRNGLDATGPGDQPPLTPEEIEEARFQPAFGGYEMDEVDEFLDRLAAELERAAPALPRPPRQPFPGVTPGPPAAALGRPAVAPGPPAAPPGRPAAAPEPPSMAPTPAAPPPGPAPPRGPAPSSGPVSGPPPASTSSPAPARAPAGAPAPPDDDLFPPASVPPSSAPAPPLPRPPAAPRPPAPVPARPMTPSEVETRSFDRGAPGYLPAHVDLFLAKAARALAGRDGETLTRWDVLRQRFPLGPRGYATSEVDAFLVRLAAQFPEPDPVAQQEILRKLEGRD
jgi:DivIVA domain-containing protein